MINHLSIETTNMHTQSCIDTGTRFADVGFIEIFIEGEMK
jgi:hypothetical protein